MYSAQRKAIKSKVREGDLGSKNGAVPLFPKVDCKNKFRRNFGSASRKGQTELELAVPFGG